MALVPPAMCADFTELSTSTSTDWNIWILCAIIGVILFVKTLQPPESNAQCESDIIISIISWVPIALCAVASFNISRVVGVGYTVGYSYPIYGYVFGIFFIAAIGNTLRIYTLMKEFKIREQEKPATEYQSINNPKEKPFDLDNYERR